MKVSTRLLILVLTALLAVAAVGANSLWTLRRVLLNDREQQIVGMLKMGEQLVTYYHNRELNGIYSREEAQSRAKAALSQLNTGSGTYLWVREPNGLNLVHPNPKNIGQIAEGETMDGRPDAAAYREELAKHHIALLDMKSRRPDGELAPKLTGLIAFPAWDWWIGTGYFYDDINATFWDAATRALLIFLTALTVILALGWNMIRSIARSLGGEPAYAETVTRRIASNDLSVAVELKQNDRHSLLFSIATMQQHLAGSVRRIRISADNIATASREIAAGNMDLSARTEHQASALEQTAATIEELTSTVRQNADNAQQANQMVSDAAVLATEGQSVVADVVRTMGNISEASRKMVDIISVIEGIAFQTNILALNAAVEAARAGEQGRGFAVVAAEVRNLAQRSAAAAKEIKLLIDTSVKQVQSGNTLVDQAGNAMVDIVAGVQGVAGIMGEIMVASREQTDGIEQINQTVSEMDAVTQQNASLVEEAAAAAESLQLQASELADVVRQFQLADVAPVVVTPHKLQLARGRSSSAD